MFIVRIECKGESGYVYWTKGRNYYDKFDALLVAEIELRDVLRAEGTVFPEPESKYMYVVDLPTDVGGDIEITVLDDDANLFVELNDASALVL